MDVSKNSGTPKSSILIRFSVINHPFWGTPIFGNTHIVKLGSFPKAGVNRTIHHFYPFQEVQPFQSTMCSRAIGTMPPSIHWKIKIYLLYYFFHLSPEFRSLNINIPNVLTFTWVKHSNLETTFDSCLNLDVGFIIFQQVECVPSLIKSLPNENS